MYIQLNSDHLKTKYMHLIITFVYDLYHFDLNDAKNKFSLLLLSVSSPVKFTFNILHFRNCKHITKMYTVKVTINVKETVNDLKHTSLAFLS